VSSGDLRNARHSAADQAQQAGERGDWPRAVELWRKAFDIAKRNRDDDFGLRFVEGRLGDALINAGNALEAEEILERSVASGFDIPATIAMLHQLWLAGDEYDKLEAAIRAGADAIRGAQGPYWNGASLLVQLAARTVDYAAAGRDNKEPLERAERLAHAIGNRDVEWLVRHQRGLAAEALGDLEGAIASYRTLMDEGCGHDQTVERLLILLERTGRDAEALKVATKLGTRLRPGSLRDSVAKRAARLAREVGKAPVKAKEPKPITRQTLGARVALADLPTDILALEAAEGQAERFAALDALTGRLLAQRLAGQAIATGSWNADRVEIPSLTAPERALLADAFAVEKIESRGSWSIPTDIRVPGHLIAPNRTEGERGHSSVQGNPEAVYLWALLAPAYEALHSPLEVRARVGRTSAEQMAQWQGVYGLFEQLGVDIRLLMDSMRYGGGWSRLSARERTAVAARLTSALAEWAPEAARHWRALVLRDLARAYYAKADADGRALRTRVLTVGLKPALIAYFGGDWLAFLDYLGEAVHPGEQIATALPEAKVMVAGASKAAAAAAPLGIPADEAAKIAATFWPADSGVSPVEDRVAALTRFWATFDEVHARQAKGMPSLWGLIAEQETPVEYDALDDGRMSPHAFAALLPAQVLAEIDRLWGRQMSPTSPDVIVCTPEPHYLVAKALGPALAFWHGIALTAWFICEGPYSRTDFEHAPEYYAKALSELEAMGTPIDPALFKDLIAAQRQLRPRERRYVDEGPRDVKGPAVVLTMTMGPGQFDGFEYLRDVITRHRRAWTATHLDPYLRRCWDGTIRDASVLYHRLLNENGRVPTIKAYGRKVATVVNTWFGGDVSLLYAAIGEKCPASVRAGVRILPGNPRTLWVAFRPLVPELPATKGADAESRQWDQQAKAADLGRFAYRWVSVWETLGHEPTLDEAGSGPFMMAQTARLRYDNYREYRVFGPDPGEAYDRFVAIAKQALAAPPPAPRPAKVYEPAPATRVAIPLDLPAEPQRDGLVARVFGLLRGRKGPGG
jgi:tetratricopeptide (TPR) repeat protein